ncbi:MAG: hypothetical protein KC423_24235 [Anaerolineales bacterium]|nr:hypothetical protein [Anaerolineales bacterium]
MASLIGKSNLQLVTCYLQKVWGDKQERPLMHQVPINSQLNGGIYE